jgi:hypothetical protein
MRYTETSVKPNLMAAATVMRLLHWQPALHCMLTNCNKHAVQL